MKFLFRIFYKKGLGTVFNLHLAVFFILKGLLLPLSLATNIDLFNEPDEFTHLRCSMLRFSLHFGMSQASIMTMSNIVFRCYCKTWL